jgi:hypothetical protein
MKPNVYRISRIMVSKRMRVDGRLIAKRRNGIHSRSWGKAEGGKQRGVARPEKSNGNLTAAGIFTELLFGNSIQYNSTYHCDLEASTLPSPMLVVLVSMKVWGQMD